MCNSGVQPTKFVFMALINAYAACGQFEKAKQVKLESHWCCFSYFFLNQRSLWLYLQLPLLLRKIMDLVRRWKPGNAAEVTAVSLLLYWQCHYVQVLLDKRIPVKSLNEIKSVLVSALASHGQLSEAFEMYEGIKEAGSNLQPKAIGCLIVS